MPTTPRGIWFPDSNASTETWLHWQQQAETVDTAIGNAQTETLADAEAYADGLLAASVIFSDRYLSADVNITNNTDWTVDFNTAPTADVGIDYTAKHWFAEEDGLYLFDGAVSFAPNADGARTVMMYLQTPSTTTQILFHNLDTGEGGTLTMPFSKKVRMEAGDSIRVDAKQSSGVTIAVRGHATSRFTRCDVSRIGN